MGRLINTMTIAAKVIADSISPAGARITTLEIVMHRFILPEFSRHRAFSLSVSSSRAIPLGKAIRAVEDDIAYPIFWGKARSGMQAVEGLDSREELAARLAWGDAADWAVEAAETLRQMGVHKQIAARVIEPFSWSRVLCTSTDFSNFFALRMHRDAQPEMQAVAVAMARALRDSEPVRRPLGCWHLPYVSEVSRLNCDIKDLLKVSAARCARVSFKRHDGADPFVGDDLELFRKLAGSTPVHASPTEHQATPFRNPIQPSGNLRGWQQHRQMIPGNTAPPDFNWLARLAEYDEAGRDFIV